MYRIVSCAVLVLASAILHGGSEPMQLQMLNYGVVKPLQFRDDRSSAAKLVKGLGSITRLPHQDIDAITSAALGVDRPQVEAWVGTREMAVITSNSELAKEIVAMNSLHKARPGRKPYVMTNNTFTTALDSLLSAVNDYPGSFSAAFEQSTTPEVAKILGSAMEGVKPGSTEIEAVRIWIESKVGNMGKSGMALKIAFMVLSDNLPFSDIKPLMDKFPAPLRLNVLILLKDAEARSGAMQLVDEMLAKPEQMEYVTSALISWGRNPTSSLLADRILSSDKPLTFEQKVGLLSLLDQRSSPNYQDIVDKLDIQSKAIAP